MISFVQSEERGVLVAQSELDYSRLRTVSVFRLTAEKLSPTKWPILGESASLGGTNSWGRLVGNFAPPPIGDRSVRRY